MVTRQAVGLVGGRTQARRQGGEDQVLEDLPGHHRPEWGNVGSEVTCLDNQEVTRNSFDAMVDSLRREIAHLEKATAL